MTMTIEVVTLGITLVGAIISAFIMVWREMQTVKSEVLDTNREVKKVHLLINSRLDELLKLTRESAHAAGVKAEKARDGRDSRFEPKGE